MGGVASVGFLLMTTEDLVKTIGLCYTGCEWEWLQFSGVKQQW